MWLLLHRVKVTVLRAVRNLTANGFFPGICCCCWVTKSCLTLQHARLPYASLSSRDCSNSCVLSQWCHPTISSFATLFFSCPQSFPELWSFTMSRLFSSGGQSIGASASASVLPMCAYTYIYVCVYISIYTYIYFLFLFLYLLREKEVPT